MASDLSTQRESSDLEHRDILGRTAAIKAAVFGNADELGVLIGRGADMEATDCLGRTALAYAAMNGHCSCLQMLMSVGCDLEKMDVHGKTALAHATAAGHMNCVSSLVWSGASLRYGWRRWRSVEEDARTWGMLDVIELLAAVKLSKAESVELEQACEHVVGGDARAKSI
jgi:ankyrin repeat protein